MLKRTIELVINTALLLYAHAVWGLALLLAWGGVAFAQNGDYFPTIDPTGWGKSPFYFGGFLLLAIAAIKRAAEQEKLKKYGQITGNPWLWRGLAILLGVGGAFGLAGAKYGAELVLFGLVSPWTIILFGLASAVVAMGGRDLLKQALGWVGGPALPEPAQQQTVVVGEVQAPADLKSPPPSGLEPIPGAGLGLFGFNLPSFGGGAAPSLSPQTIEGLVLMLLQLAGLQGTPLQMFRVGAKLAMVAPDLMDGDLHLSSDSLARINNVILDLKKAGGLT